MNWELVKEESISTINDIVDDAGAVLLDELTETKVAGVNLQEQCQFYLDNYKRACKELEEEEDSALVSKAEIFIEE